MKKSGGGDVTFREIPYYKGREGKILKELLYGSRHFIAH